MPARSAPPLEKFHLLIWKNARYCHLRLPPGSGYDLDELFQEGCLVYVTCLRKWRPERAQFITLLTLMLQHHFGALLNRAHRQKLLPLAVDEDGDPVEYDVEIEVSDRAGALADLFERRLSPEAWLFVREVLDPSRDFLRWHAENYPRCRLDEAGRPAANAAQMRPRIARYFGWGVGQMNRVAAELAAKLPQEAVRTACRALAAAASDAYTTR